MKQHFDTFLRVVDALDKSEVEYILIGGYAVIIHGLPRFTIDMDIFVKMEKNNIDLLRQTLTDIFEDIQLAEITFEEIEQYPVIRYGAPDGFVIDIIGRLGIAYCYDDLEYESIDIEGHSVRVATPETLYRLKHDTARPQDKIDADFLKNLIEKRKISGGR